MRIMNLYGSGSMRRGVYSVLLSILGILSSCSDDLLSNLTVERGDYIEIKLVGELGLDSIIEYVSIVDIRQLVKYDVSYYKVVYRTEYMGRGIDASGLLLIPKGVDDCKLLGYFHGTQIPINLAGVNKQIPSFYRGERRDFIEVRNIGLPWASAGYAVFMPDYIGYGISAGVEHPYNYYSEMFKSNIDGLLAVKSFLTEQEYISSGNLFLTGWSQGAGASLSAHKYIEESYADDFKVIASSNMAGPYNFSGFMDDIVERQYEATDIINVLSWSAYSLNKFSGLHIPSDQIFAYSVYDQISALNTPSRKPANIFNSLFLSRLNASDEDSFKKIASANSFHKDWKPKGAVFLHHCGGDRVVPIFNTTDAYAGLRGNDSFVQMYQVNGGSHYTLDNFVYRTIVDFKALEVAEDSE